MKKQATEEEHPYHKYCISCAMWEDSECQYNGNCFDGDTWQPCPAQQPLDVIAELEFNISKIPTKQLIQMYDKILSEIESRGCTW